MSEIMTDREVSQMRLRVSRPLQGLIVLVCAALFSVELGAQQMTDSVSIRGRAQTLHLYGRRGGPPVIVSSGDGGWMHLGPHVAEFLASRGFFVVGFDARAYLEGFTSG